jgi:hypothetical protein
MYFIYKYIINATTTAINACKKIYLTVVHCVQLPDNFQMRKHSWPCRFHIKIKQDVHFTTLKRFKIIKLTNL